MREGSDSSSKELPNITFFFKKIFIGQIQYQPKFTSWPELAGMTEMDRNGPKFDSRWNVGYSGTNLHTGTKNFSRFDRNGMESITIDQRLIVMSSINFLNSNFCSLK